MQDTYGGVLVENKWLASGQREARQNHQRVDLCAPLHCCAESSITHASLQHCVWTTWCCLLNKRKDLSLLLFSTELDNKSPDWLMQYSLRFKSACRASLWDGLRRNNTAPFWNICFNEQTHFFFSFSPFSTFSLASQRKGPTVKMPSKTLAPLHNTQPPVTRTTCTHNTQLEWQFVLQGKKRNSPKLLNVHIRSSGILWIPYLHKNNRLGGRSSGRYYWNYNE